MLVPHDLAQAIATAQSRGTVSPELVGWATGVIQEITTNAKVSNASGTITGTVPAAGGSLTNGAGTNGMIASMIASSMAHFVVTATARYAPGATPRLTNFCKAIVDHIQNDGRVTFTSGNITGNCTNSISTPGILASGAGIQGKISALNGTTLANLVATDDPYPSTSPELIQFCTAVTTYIMANADVTYAAGNVTGTAPAAGGTLNSGAASGGTIL